MCGIAGICTPRPEAGALAHGALLSLQHRGLESWGVAVHTGGSLAARRRMGLVPWPPDPGMLPPARLAIAHTRYSTTGTTHIDNAQPLGYEGGGRRIAIAHNGNLLNAGRLRAELAAGGYRFRSTSDSEVILALLASTGGDPAARVAAAVRVLAGAYSVVAMLDGELVAFRDPNGFHPLALGRLPGGGIAVSSETCALDLLGCADQREIGPGELVAARPGGAARTLDGPASHGARTRGHLCFLESAYLARPDSRLGGTVVTGTREELGARLAEEAPAGADRVIGVPASGVPAARGYARRAGLPLTESLVRNDYVRRTFIQPDPQVRELANRLKFNVAGRLDGARVVVVDDSIVRGTTMRRVVRLLREAGAREVHVRIAAPPLVAPCPYGVDIADPVELAAVRARRRAGTVTGAVGADSLAHLSLAGLRRVLAASTGGDACTGCLTGHYPDTSPPLLDKHRFEPAHTR